MLVSHTSLGEQYDGFCSLSWRPKAVKETGLKRTYETAARRSKLDPDANVDDLVKVHKGRLIRARLLYLSMATIKETEAAEGEINLSEFDGQTCINLLTSRPQLCHLL